MATRGPSLLTGVAAGAMTVGVAELLAVGLARTLGTEAEPSPVLAVGNTFVDLTPLWLKNLAVDLFGTADKIALFVGMGLVLTVLCALLGWIASRTLAVGVAGFVLAGAIGVFAVQNRAGATLMDALPTVVGVLVGIGVLVWLRRRGEPHTVVDGDGLEVSRLGDHDRRSVLMWGSVLTAAGGLALVAGRTLGQAGEVVRQARERFRLPTPTNEVTVPDDAQMGVEGQSDYVTPNSEFYRIDTALSVPQVDPAQWSIRVHGMVEQEVEMTFAELLEQPMIESLTTLTCVSNEVGGDLVGNSVWTGWPIRELLAMARPRSNADMVLSTSEDNFTAGTPIEALTDDREAILAVAMNGEPLPAEHGFPVRMVVPGLYGYVSATKWVVDLKVTRFDQDEGYWTPRGWSARGPIKTASRIDVPRGGNVSPDSDGNVIVAGVAWAQHRGIERVEVRVDEGQWQEATLASEPTIDSWRLWRWEWPAESGEHTLQVRATDGDGEVQTSETAPPAPNGASGWHSVQVTVE